MNRGHRSRQTRSVVGTVAPLSLLTAVLATSPSALWKLDEAFGAATYADSSGNSLTATVAGTPVSGCHSLICNVPTSPSVYFGAIGRAGLASTATFDYSVQTAFSSMVTIAANPGGGFEVIWSKCTPASTSGYEMFCNGDGSYQLRLNGGGNTRIYSFKLNGASAQNAVSGIFQVIISQSATWATTPVIYVNGTSVTVTPSGTTPTTGFTNASAFTLGARTDGSAPYSGSIQYAAFWSGVALTATQVATLWAAHNSPTNRLDFILDSDCGVGDRGDIIDFAYVAALHQAKLINLLGVISDSNVSRVCAPSTKAMLLGLHALFPTAGFDIVRVGSYQGTDSSNDAGGPCTLVTASAGAPYNTQTGADYESPESFYAACFAGKATASVVVVCDGTAHAIQKYCNASGANLATFNSTVKLFHWSAGQFQNSSDAATPVGNYAAATNGEHNISYTATAITNAQYLVSNITCPWDWSGILECGGTGNSPALTSFISSGTPGGYAAGNLIRVGTSNLSRTAWDQHGSEAAFSQATIGNGGGWLTVNDIAVPVISALGHNTSTAGSSNHHYFSQKLGTLTLANWRTKRGSYLNCLFPIAG